MAYHVLPAAVHFFVHDFRLRFFGGHILRFVHEIHGLHQTALLFGKSYFVTRELHKVGGAENFLQLGAGLLIVLQTFEGIENFARCHLAGIESVAALQVSAQRIGEFHVIGLGFLLSVFEARDVGQRGFVGRGGGIDYHAAHQRAAVGEPDGEQYNGNQQKQHRRAFAQKACVPLKGRRNGRVRAGVLVGVRGVYPHGIHFQSQGSGGAIGLSVHCHLNRRQAIQG